MNSVETHVTFYEIQRLSAVSRNQISTGLVLGRTYFRPADVVLRDATAFVFLS